MQVAVIAFAQGFDMFCAQVEVVLYLLQLGGLANPWLKGGGQGADAAFGTCRL